MEEPTQSAAKQDVLIYAGEINRQGYDALCHIFDSEPPEEGCQSALLILTTYGGDPDAAYRICRALHHHYPEGFTAFIPGLCKSAGTLIVIGARAIIMSARGELGPLDVQIAKPDELFGRSSGLDLPQAIENLQAHAIRNFRECLIDIRMGGKLSTSMAAKIATEITTGLYQPIFAQIDPTKVGETQRAMLIGYNYGQRLNEKFQNLHPHYLEQLTLGYPSHGFVIDRREARDLFKSVERPDDALQKTADGMRLLLDNALHASDNPLVKRINGQDLEPTNNDTDASKETDANESDGKTSGVDQSLVSASAPSSRRAPRTRAPKTDKEPDKSNGQNAQPGG